VADWRAEQQVLLFLVPPIPLLDLTASVTRVVGRVIVEKDFSALVLTIREVRFSIHLALHALLTGLMVLLLALLASVIEILFLRVTVV
jgi:hypothetical protein